MIRLLAVPAACLALAACDETPPTPSPDTPDGVERIGGGERIGWDQQAFDATELGAFGYAVYVDGARVVLADASCSGATATAGFACSAGLPALLPGVHTLELTAFIVSAGGVLESERSAPLTVEVAPGAALTQSSGEADWQIGTPVVTEDGQRLRLDLVATGLEDPVDLALGPDRRVFVAERAGRVRIIDGGRLLTEPALVPDRAVGEGVLALALDPRFGQSGLVFAVQTVDPGVGGPTFRIARFREVDGRFGERTILLEGIAAPSTSPAASLRFGPDGRLYAAFDDLGDARLGADAASFNGKVLRLDVDGTTPDDRAAITPIFASGFRSPRGFDWRPVDGTLWLADVSAERSERLSVVAETGSPNVRAAVGMQYALPRSTGVAGVAFHPGDLMPAFRGDLLLAGGEGRVLLRLRFDAAGIAASERLLHDRVGPIRAVAVSSRGEIYFGTPSAVGRLAPSVR
jgi:glucose/arabinose dehydrogenase